jgi:hypothetical protein
MTDILVPKDAFSHGQIKSKLWLTDQFHIWSRTHLNIQVPYTLNWLGSWVGMGPFLFLANNLIPVKNVHLYELNIQHLDISIQLLDRWVCEGIQIEKHHSDVNTIFFKHHNNSIFINTSCEHMPDSTWLKNIPRDSLMLLQSTNMPHLEHTNSALSLEHFIIQVAPHMHILESCQLDFNYIKNGFSRYMLFGKKL